MKKYDFPGVVSSITNDVRYLLVYNSYAPIIWMPGKYHGMSLQEIERELELLFLCLDIKEKRTGEVEPCESLNIINDKSIMNLIAYLNLLIALKKSIN